ncbi:MAG: lysylphosphatidylglycerol synthase transmembrane domain-containing protein [Chloroflexota bacterium]
MHVLRSLYDNRLVRYAVAGVLLGLVVWKAQPDRIATAVTSVRPGYLLLALALTAPFLWLKSLRWYLMLRGAGIQASLNEATLSLIGGMGLALLTPARIGELVRAAYLRDSRKLTIGGLVIIDKGFDVLVLSGLSVAGAWILIGRWLGGLLAVATILGIVAVYNPATVSRALHGASSRLPLRNRLEQIWNSTDSLSTRGSTLYLLLTIGSFAIVLLQFGIVLLSWHSWSFQIVFLTFPLVVLTNVLPVTIGGLGVREGAATLLLAHYGISPAHAALAAFLMFLMNTALPGLAGAALLPRRRLRPAIDASLDGS